MLWGIETIGGPIDGVHAYIEDGPPVIGVNLTAMIKSNYN